MSFKQSIAALIVLFSVSFSAWSNYVELTSYGNNAGILNGCTGWDIGTVVKADQMYNLNTTYNNGVCNSVSTHFNRARVYWTRYDGEEFTGDYNGKKVYSCPDDYVVNPNTGECEEPKIPYCEQTDTINEMNKFRDSCLAEGNGWTADISCSNENESLSMSCNPPPPTGCEPGSPSYPGCLEDKCDENHPDWNPEYGICCSPENNWCDVPAPETCTVVSPDWPECDPNYDPVTPPTGGDLGDPSKPEGGGSGNPDPDKPEPDVEEPTDTNNAIKAMNEDLNKQLTAINNDLNKNHAENKSALDALKASVDLNTDTVVDSANHVANAVDGQSDMLAELGNKTNALLSSNGTLLNNGFGEVVNGLNGLESSNQQGFADVVDALEGLGDIQIETGYGTENNPLYDSAQLDHLLLEVSALEIEYRQVLNDFKNFFNFNSGVNSGEFNAHNIDLNWHGNAINKTNQVMIALQDNAGIISAVVMFFFGMLGIRAITGAL